LKDDSGFDLWAADYDSNVSRTDEKESYPFAGYNDLLEFVYKEIEKNNGKTVLDIGIGTGNLAKQLYDKGYTVYGIDFSGAMIEISKEKMPGAELIKWDFSKGLPYIEEKFDYIISTYALHHLSDNDKVKLINDLKNFLSLNGVIIIGDISFYDREKLNICRKDNLAEWDEDEIYFVYEDIKNELEYNDISYVQISFCAGVYIIKDCN